jgi:hypothetical protein
MGPQGESIDLKHVDFSFCLQITTLYDNIMPFKVQDVDLG